jgi:D-tyrosyl-tRNA(Tyr) deacylase
VKALLQRVSSAEVRVAGAAIAAIGTGLLVFIGIEPDDTDAECRWIADRILDLRVFPDARLPMNRSVCDVGAAVLVVSQFTLAADTARGRRPGFSHAAPPEAAARSYARVVEYLRERWPGVQTGRFGADMQVALVNEGPATFILERTVKRPADAPPR